jgi:hypothetical protein
VVCPCTGGGSRGWRLGRRAQVPRVGFIGAGGGMVAWARDAGEGETRGKTGGAAASMVSAARWSRVHATARQEAEEERGGRR